MGLVTDQASLPQAPLHWCGLAPKCVLRHASARVDLSNSFVHRAHSSLVGDAPLVNLAEFGAMVEEDTAAFDIPIQKVWMALRRTYLDSKSWLVLATLLRSWWIE
jgi:hypothetical protein